ncbi:MAG: hypothetical protein FRX49_13315 [Trebouxia sp. A1-2]|nr:MAG: hypothetical protein FRX49_13315 [Trebouxia sp. A1-2]
MSRSDKTGMDSWPPQPKKVGRGLDAATKSPKDPQLHLAGSNHPYAPFTGNALKWESNVYDDGTTFEGLTREGIPHGKGVLVMGNGTGGGFHQPGRGDRYEGEFAAGFAHGLGVYTAVDGQVYRGEFMYGRRHGCGSVTNIAPYHQRLEEGVEPTKAWEQSRDEIDEKIKYGTWNKDYFLSKPDDSGRFCHAAEIKGVLQELESVVTRARHFQFKPDGEVTFMMAQDAVGLPAPLMQDPMHYPHGTKFMAPGPMGQCFPIPDDEDIKRQMVLTAENQHKIYRMYNFDYVTKPGSDMAKAEKLWAKKQRKLAARRARNRHLQQLRLRRQQRQAARRGERLPQAVESEDESGPDDDNLYAFTSLADSLDQAASSSQEAQQQEGSSAGQTQSSSRQPAGFGGPTAFASLTLGMNHAVVQLNRAFQQMAVRAQHRRCLTRPS